MATLNGTAGNDTLISKKGEVNTINGLGGDDTIYGGDGNDVLDGGDGNDKIYGQSSGDKILRGGAGNDLLNVYTGTGNNLLDGGSGDDTLYGGAGNDTLIGGGGNDTIDGNTGNDSLDGGDGNDILNAGEGNDTLIGGRGDDRLLGQAGNDTYQFSKGDGSDFLQDYDTTAGNIDVVLFTDVRSTDITSVTQSGTDLILKYGVNDQLLVNFYFGSPANFLIEQFKFSDGVTWGITDIKSRTVQNGTAASDRLQGYKGGPNTINGLGGDDTIFGGDGDDVLDGGDGNDTIYGQSSGNKILRGGAGNDRLDVFNGTGNNFLDGGDDNDILYGGTGNDTLDGGSGVNELYGGLGNDTYIISSPTTYIRDDGGTDKAIVNTNFVKIPSNVETVTYAAGVQALPYWIDALTSSDSNGSNYKTLLGSGKTMTYSFPTSIPAYDTSAQDALGWQPFNDAQKTFARQTLAYITSLVDVKFVESTASDVANNIAFANNLQTGSSGYAVYPSVGLIGSDLFLNKSAKNADNLNPRDGDYSALTLIHELGHSLGLKHPFGGPDARGDIVEGPYLTSSEDNSVWTVMTYTSQLAQSQAVYRPLDVAALQYLYGVNPSYKPGNDVYVVSATTTNLIYDGGGNDTLDASQQTLPATIFLEPGYWGFVGTKAATISAPGQISVNFGTTIENLKSGSGNDFLVGNAADNQIEGGGGNDTIDGGAGIDTAVYAGPKSEYSVYVFQGTAHVTDSVFARSGVDTLSNVERLQFQDTKLALDLDGNTGQVVKILGAVFGAAAVGNKGYVGIGLSYLDAGMSYANLNQLAIDARLGGRASNADVVKLLYKNVVGMEPDTAALALYKGLLDNGTYTQGSLGVLAADTSENSTNVNLVGLASTGVEFF